MLGQKGLKNIGFTVFSLKNVKNPLVLLCCRSKNVKKHWFYCVFAQKCFKKNKWFYCEKNRKEQKPL